MSKINKIAIYVRGGVIQSIISNTNIKATIFDVDDKKAAGISDKEIDKRWDDLQEDMIHSVQFILDSNNQYDKVLGNKGEIE